MQENNLGIYDVLYVDEESPYAHNKHDFARFYAEDEDHVIEKFYNHYPSDCKIQEVIYRGEA